MVVFIFEVIVEKYGYKESWCEFLWLLFLWLGFGFYVFINKKKKFYKRFIKCIVYCCLEDLIYCLDIF